MKGSQRHIRSRGWDLAFIYKSEHVVKLRHSTPNIPRPHPWLILKVTKTVKVSSLDLAIKRPGRNGRSLRSEPLLIKRWCQRLIVNHHKCIMGVLFCHKWQNHLLGYGWNYSSKGLALQAFCSLLNEVSIWTFLCTFNTSCKVWEILRFKNLHNLWNIFI